MAGRLDYVTLGDEYIGNFVKSPAAADYELKLQLPDNIPLGDGVAYAVRKGDAEALAKVNGPLEKVIGPVAVSVRFF